MAKVDSIARILAMAGSSGSSYDDTEIKKEIADIKKYVDDSIAELDVIDGGTF